MCGLSSSISYVSNAYIYVTLYQNLESILAHIPSWVTLEVGHLPLFSVPLLSHYTVGHMCNSWWVGIGQF